MAQLETQHVVLAEGRVAIVDATALEAAQSGHKSADAEAGSRVKVNVTGKIQAVWGYQALQMPMKTGSSGASRSAPAPTQK